MNIPFNKAFMVGKELEYIAQAVLNGEIKGDGPFTRKCQALMENMLSSKKVLLTNSCTAALEMSALLCGVEPNDEILLPSYTFVSTANAFLLRGAKPVFVDIREDTLNIDEVELEQRITARTKLICPVHYAGVPCEMDSVLKSAQKSGLFVVEDAAQALLSKYRGNYAGTLGDIGAISFHETKNYSSGEGGAIIINREDFIERSEILWEKGTNRRKFFRGEIDKYSWVDIGGSYLPSEIIAAFLYAQLQNAHNILERRMDIWKRYLDAISPLAKLEGFSIPKIPSHCHHNAHIFYLLMPDEDSREKLRLFLLESGILAVFHYQSLHESEMGKRYGYKSGDYPITESVSKRLLRLPLYFTLETTEQEYIVEKIHQFFGAKSPEFSV